MNYKPAPDWVVGTKPVFLEQATQLVEQTRTQKDLAKTLAVSQRIADQNRERFEAWSPQLNADDLQPALWAYSGDIYNGVAVSDWAKDAVVYAQDNLRIISGLYGLARPFDLIQPYRLEMITRLTGPWGKNLYDFWGSQLGEWLGATKPTYMLDAGSVAYSKAVVPHLPNSVTVITPEFLQDTPDGPKQKALFSKYARGLLARWVMQQQVEKPGDLAAFDLEDLSYSQQLSTEFKPVYIIPADFSLLGRFTKT